MIHRPKGGRDLRSRGRSYSYAAAAALCIALIGCKDQQVVAAPKAPIAPPPATPTRAAFLSVSDLSPLVGSTVIVTGNVAIDDSLSLASFKVRLAYDRKTLHYLDAIELPGMMRVINAQASEIIVAGASGSGSTDGRLFAMHFRVDDPAGLETLALYVDELNDIHFNSGLSSVRRESRLHLERQLSGGHVSPP